MHGYDVTGITIDDEKKKRKWVSPNFLKTYTDKAYCLWESYEDALRHHKRDVKVNDKIDSENLADFVGMVTSYAAMKLLPEHEGREPNSYVPDKRPGPQMEPTDVDGSSLGERNWLKVTFFCLVAALPITICSLLLALVVFTPEVALEETNT
ncbi:hypothetical protein MRX96_048242, partial [Rhipicephalus microplus]